MIGQLTLWLRQARAVPTLIVVEGEPGSGVSGTLDEIHGLAGGLGFDRRVAYALETDRFRPGAVLERIGVLPVGLPVLVLLDHAFWSDWSSLRALAEDEHVSLVVGTDRPLPALGARHVLRLVLPREHEPPSPPAFESAWDEELAFAAAILGMRCRLSAAAGLAGQAPDDAMFGSGRLEQLGVLRERPAPQAMQFAHRSMRDAVYGLIPQERRAALHASAAAAKHRLGEPAHEVAWHLLPAAPGAFPGAAAVLRAVAEPLRAGGDDRAAAALLARAEREPA